MQENQIKIRKPFLSGISHKKQKLIWAAIFLAPWIFGFLLLFLYPVVESLMYSFSSLNNYEKLGFVGLENYHNVLNLHTVGTTFFKVELLVTIKDTFIFILVIPIFSLLMATLLNTEFKGRAVARALFFIPVIINSAAVISAMSNLNLPTESITDSFFELEALLIKFGLGEGFVTFLSDLVATMTKIVTLSGIPILLFLSSIQSIPSHLYEAAKMEGATSYEMFWLITFPNITPHLMTVFVFVLIDSFLESSASTYIQKTISLRGENFVGLSSAMSWIYTLVVLLILAIIALLAKSLNWGKSHYES